MIILLIATALQFTATNCGFHNNPSMVIELSLGAKINTVKGIDSWDRSKKGNKPERFHIVKDPCTITLQLTKESFRIDTQRATLMQDDGIVNSVQCHLKSFSSVKECTSALAKLAAELKIDKQLNVKRNLTALPKLEPNDGLIVKGLLGYRTLVSIELKPLVSDDPSMSRWTLSVSAHLLDARDWNDAMQIDPDRWKVLDAEGHKP